MSLVAVGYAVTATVLFVRHDSDHGVVTAVWLSVFGITNGVLALFVRRGRRWARVVVLVLYTLSVVRDAALLFEGGGTTANVVSLLVAALVIVLLTGPASSQGYFDGVEHGQGDGVEHGQGDGVEHGQGDKADAAMGDAELTAAQTSADVDGEGNPGKPNRGR